MNRHRSGNRARRAESRRLASLIALSSLTFAFSGWSSLTELPDDVVSWTKQNFDWMEQQLAGPNGTNWYWTQISLLLAQLHGMADGASAALPGQPGVDFLSIVISNMDGDLGDLNLALNVTARSAWRSMTRQEFDLYRAKTTHCSSLIRVADDFSDLFAAHATWDSFGYMLRHYKLYNFQFSSAKAKQVHLVEGRKKEKRRTKDGKEKKGQRREQRKEQKKERKQERKQERK